MSLLNKMSFCKIFPVFSLKFNCMHPVWFSSPLFFLSRVPILALSIPPLFYRREGNSSLSTGLSLWHFWCCKLNEKDLCPFWARPIPEACCYHSSRDGMSPAGPPPPCPASWSNRTESVSLHNDNITEASVWSHWKFIAFEPLELLKRLQGNDVCFFKGTKSSI